MARFRHSWADYDGPASDSPGYGLSRAWETPDPADPPGRLPDQVAAARDALLAGTSPIDVRSQLSATYGAKAQPRKAIQRAIQAIEQDESIRREHLPGLVQAIRFSAVQRALAMGQVGPAAALLRDIEAAAAVHGQGEAGHGLLITVEGPQEDQEALPAARQVESSTPASGEPSRGAQKPVSIESQ